MRPVISKEYFERNFVNCLSISLYVSVLLRPHKVNGISNFAPLPRSIVASLYNAKRDLGAKRYIEQAIVVVVYIIIDGCETAAGPGPLNLRPNPVPIQ